MIPITSIIKNIVFIFFVFFIFSKESISQNDSLKEKNIEEQIEFIAKYQNWVNQEKQIPLLFQYMDEIIKNNNPSNVLSIEAQFIKLIYYSKHRSKLIIEYTNQKKILLKYAETSKSFETLARIEQLEGGWYWDKQEYEKAFEHFFNHLSYCNKSNDKQKARLTSCLFRLSKSYYFFEDFDNSIFYARELLKNIPKKEDFYFKSNNLTLLGLCYRKKHEYEISNNYFKQALELSLKEKNKDWISISEGNLGQNYYLQGKFSMALPLLENDFENSKKRKDWSNAAIASICNAEIYLKTNVNSNFIKEMNELDSIMIHPLTDIHKPRWFLLKMKQARLNGNSIAAEAFLDSSFLYREKLTNKFNKLQLLRANQKFEAANKLKIESEALSNLKAEKQQKYLLLLFMFLLSVGIIFLYRSILAKNKIKALSLENRMIQKEADLQISMEKLNQFSIEISNKTKIIEELENSNLSENQGIILNLKNKTILTDEDWKSFKTLFVTVYGNYLTNIKEKWPTLSLADERYIVLSKLKFSPKEMAEIQGISTNTVYQNKGRLKRKLNIEDDSEIETRLSGSV